MSASKALRRGRHLESVSDRAARSKALDRIAATVRPCTACRLHNGRTHAVPGEGPAGARVFLIGEAPGRSEDASGRPFVGSAGQVLDAALAAVRLPRREVFITNVVKCRPPENRPPRTDEAKACRPYLLGEIAAVRPKVIVTLGSTALRMLLGPEADLRGGRGTVFAFGLTPVLATYHPAAILYNRRLETAFRRDLRKAVRLARRPRSRVRSGPPRHGRPTRTIRSSGAAVVNRRGQVLLLRKADEAIWCLPKGAMETGETAEDTALREVREETGLRVKLLRPLTELRYAYYWPPHRVNYDKTVTYFLAVPAGGRLVPEEEFDAARWVSLREAIQLLRWKNDRDVVMRAFESRPSVRPTGGTRGPSRAATRSTRPRA